MTIFRAFWALLLAGLVAYTFHRSWRWEHGTPMPEPVFGGDKPRTKETVVWFDPSFLPLLLLLFLLLFGATEGMAGVERFLSLSLDVMLVISIYFLLLIFLLPIFRRYFSARACATMWILPVFLFWQAQIMFRSAPVPHFVIYIPSHILKGLFILWSIGFVVVFAGKFVSHFVFRRRVMSASVPVRDPAVTELFDRELKASEYYHPVRLAISPAVSVPLSMGMWKKTRVTVLPDRKFTQQELQFIFRHEIHHLQRGDVSNKIFFAFCQAWCWFNPLMWLAARKASEDLELSCDEIVLEDMDEGQRRQYAELLLDTAGHSCGFTTCLSAAAETMRYRLKNVVTVRNRWPGTVLLAVTMFLCVMSYGTIAVSSERGTVSDLILEGRTADHISSVFYEAESETQLHGVYDWDRDGLFSYLTSLEAEKLGSTNQLNGSDGQRLAVLFDYDGLMELFFYDEFIRVYHFQDGGRTEYFYLRSKLDWEHVKSFLDFDAEAPQEPEIRDLQMRVRFDVEDELIFAVRRHFRAWEAETGETLRAWNNSDAAGGLSGFYPTQAQLIFDLPVSEITVWVQDWDFDAQSTTELEIEDDCYFLPLRKSSAHYQVDVVYAPENGIQYEGTYVFDVEMPE